MILFLYPFAIYPGVLLFIRNWLLPRRLPLSGDSKLPSLAILICALNEERIIGEKLKNCLELEYPRRKLRILVVSDGSTDATATIVREYADRGIELIDWRTRRGKIARLNEALPTLCQEIVVLSDANVLYRSDALLHVIEEFRDPSVGCVSGKVVLTNAASAFEKPTEGYYSVEWFLQEAASALYSMVGADGAMYAIRRSLFRPCPDDTIIEDFVIPMSVVRQGKRVVFQPKAIGWEEGAQNISEEFRRKVRIAAGSAQGLLRGNVWPGLAPLRFWFVFLSHKLLRWLSPVLAVWILATAFASLDRRLSQMVVAGFALLVAMALLRIVTGSKRPIFDVPFYFLFAQVAASYGLCKGILGNQSVLWVKADR